MASNDTYRENREAGGLRNREFILNDISAIGKSRDLQGSATRRRRGFPSHLESEQWVEKSRKVYST